MALNVGVAHEVPSGRRHLADIWNMRRYIARPIMGYAVIHVVFGFFLLESVTFFTVVTHLAVGATLFASGALVWRRASGLVDLVICALVVDILVTASVGGRLPYLFEADYVVLLPTAVCIAWEARFRLTALHTIFLISLMFFVQPGHHSGTDNIGLLISDLAVFLLSITLVHLISIKVRTSLAVFKHDAATDYLTGLPNRRHLETSLQGPWLSRRGPNEHVAAIVLDLDHFKRINDTYGHIMGDKVLQETADCIKGVLREKDLVARIGGEEIVIFARVAGTSAALGVAERLRLAIAAEVRSAPVTASIGVAVASSIKVVHQPEFMWMLLDAADEAMYQAKEQGRNCCVVKVVADQDIELRRKEQAAEVVIPDSETHTSRGS